jgi:hypothetical protein
VDEAELSELTRLLQQPRAVQPADGLPVVVRSVRLARSDGNDELLIDYSVHPLPDAVAQQPLPRDSDLVAYAAQVAEEVQAWATEHVRKFRPLPPPDLDRIRQELPPREELWRLLRDEFHGVRDVPGGFVGHLYDDHEIGVMLTPDQWQEYVVRCEIGCRNDYGVDADSAGSGPMVAIGDVEENAATMDEDEHFLVLDGHQLRGSTRAELPVVRGTALERETEELRRRGGGGRWFA